jgi:hypothetical protein
MIEDINIQSLRGLISDDTLILYTNKLQSLSNIKQLATCPVTVTQGVIKNMTISPLGGTPPYTVSLLVDGTPKVTIPNVTGPTSVAYNFLEVIGTNHTIQTKVTDSCIPPQIATDQVCALNIIADTPPNVITFISANWETPNNINSTIRCNIETNYIGQVLVTVNGITDSSHSMQATGALSFTTSNIYPTNIDAHICLGELPGVCKDVLAIIQQCPTLSVQLII